MNLLENKRIIIIGGTSGIGLATAQLAKKAGAELIITGLTDNDLTKAAKELEATVKIFKLDISDENWDLFLMTLNYHGQIIDLGSADQCSVYDSHHQQWVPIQTNFSTATLAELNGIQLPVINRKDLIAYKSLLKRSVDIEDIQQIHD